MTQNTETSVMFALAELQAQRVAEVAARLQVEVESREAAARERVTAMQQALIQLQAERDVLHEHLQKSDSATTAAPSPAVVRLAMGGVALSLFAVVAMAIVLLTPPARPRTPEVATKIVYLPAPPPIVPPPAASLPPAAPASAPLKSTPGRPHQTSRNKPVTPTPVPPNPTACADDPRCADDPLCGLKFKP